MKAQTKNKEARFVGTNWDAEVSVQFRGLDRTCMARKVKTRGVRYVAASKQLQEAIDFLRQGYEVYLNDGTTEKEGIRLYPCVDRDCRVMEVCARTMGAFRDETLGDKKFVLKHCGEEIDADEADERGREHYEQRKAEQDEITPDTVVTCPKCGNKFRVGRRLAK